MDRHVFVLRDLFRKLISKYKSEAELKNASFELELADNNLEITADPGLLEETLACLIENALKFSNEGVKITLQAEKTAKGVRIAIADTGIGMDETTIQASLKPLRQGDSKITRRFEGMGQQGNRMNALTV